MAIPSLELLGPAAPLRHTLAALSARPTLPPLAPKAPFDESLRQEIKDLTIETMFDDDSLDRPYEAICLISGLLLWNDCLDDSHELSQSIETETGSYWHAIMHRREPDYSNGKYWFRRVGRHAAFPAVHTAALGVLRDAGHGFRWATETAGQMETRGEWDPFAFVDWCQACEEGVLSPQSRFLLEQIQLREIEILIDHCLRSALGRD